MPPAMGSQTQAASGRDSQGARYRGGDLRGVASPFSPLLFSPSPDNGLPTAAGHLSGPLLHVLLFAVIPLCPLCVLTAGNALYVFRKCL